MVIEDLRVATLNKVLVLLPGGSGTKDAIDRIIGAILTCRSWLDPPLLVGLYGWSDPGMESS